MRIHLKDHEEQPRRSRLFGRLSGSEEMHLGRCHRCGWRCPVSRVSRTDRRALGIRHSFGRLCESCRADLKNPDAEARRVISRRSVA